mgnify:CR=1 FL=1
MKSNLEITLKENNSEHSDENAKENKGLVLFSSPHAFGYTYKLLDLFIKTANKYSFTVIDCYKKNVSPCIACGYCEKIAGCIFRDMDDIDIYLKTVDLLIFSSPIYNFSFPAPMKSVLDRMQRYFSERFSLNVRPPINKKKKGILLLSCGSEDTRGLEVIELQLKKIFTVINCELKATLVLKGTDKLDSFPSPLIKKQVKKTINIL